MLELFFIRFMMESTSFGVHGRKKKEFRGVWVIEALEEVPGMEFEMVLPIVEKCWFRLLHIISLSKICWLLISRDLIFGILWFLLGFRTLLFRQSVAYTIDLKADVVYHTFRRSS